MLAATDRTLVPSKRHLAIRVPRLAYIRSMMTSSLAKAFERAQQTEPRVQDMIAVLIEEELESERGWDERFAKSQDALASLAKKAIADHRSGRTLPWPGEDE